MQLSIINGSPRGASGNTEKLLSHFINGFMETEGNSVELIHSIGDRPLFEKSKELFLRSKNLLIAFPLYVDAMPGSVKELFEALQECSYKNPDLSLMFMIQCGFPETHHTRFVARYCEKLSSKLGAKFNGTICKGGCEGLAVQPQGLVEKVFAGFYQIGKSYGMSGKLDQSLLDKLAYPEQLSHENIKQVIPMVNSFLWDYLLKKNNALDKSFDKPYKL